MTTTEKLTAIADKLRELLALAEKRTRGKWRWDGDPSNMDAAYRDQNAPWLLEREDSVKPVLKGDIECPTPADFTFIADCAGNAEAGWRSTLAAIEFYFEMQKQGFDAKFMADAIRAAWKGL
jgi:hypothetical protein